MSHLIIRSATEHDTEMIPKVLGEAFRPFQSIYSKAAFAATVIGPEEVRKRLREGPVWVAEYEGKPVGTISILPKENEMYVRGMAVLPAAQGLKIGLALLEQAERFALENSCRRLFLRTTPYLDKAIRLYEQFGFVRMASGEEDFFGTPSFVMEKKLPEQKL